MDTVIWSIWVCIVISIINEWNHIWTLIARKRSNGCVVTLMARHLTEPSRVHGECIKHAKINTQFLPFILIHLDCELRNIIIQQTIAGIRIFSFSVPLKNQKWLRKRISWSVHQGFVWCSFSAPWSTPLLFSTIKEKASHYQFLEHIRG